MAVGRWPSLAAWCALAACAPPPAAPPAAPPPEAPSDPGSPAAAPDGSAAPGESHGGAGAPGEAAPGEAAGGKAGDGAAGAAVASLQEMATLPFEGGEAAYYAPAAPGARPLTIFLHGMCATGKLECPVFAEASRVSWLLCPDGNAGCNGGGWMWASMDKAAEKRLNSAVTALRARHGDQAGAGPMAMVGYSLGAPAALVQVMREPGRYDRLMIVNASVEPGAAAMKKAGVRRVALVAGARDATAGKLKDAARRLAAGGVEASFFALEATGHYFDGQSQGRLAAPLAWLLAP